MVSESSRAFSGRKVLVGLLVSLIWLVILWWRGSDHATLFSKWTDNVSNISSAQIFLENGFSIYGRAAQDFTGGHASAADKKWSLDLATADFFKREAGAVGAENGAGAQQVYFLAWPESPRPYPPGAFLLFSPSALLTYKFNLGFQIPVWFNALLFLFLAHLAFFRFINFFQTYFCDTSKLFRIGAAFVVITVYSELVMWALQGQYEFIIFWPLIEMIRSYKEKKCVSLIFFFALALFLHLHAVIYAPLVALSLFTMRKSVAAKDSADGRDHSSEYSRGQWLMNGVSILMLFASTYCLWKTFSPYAIHPVTRANPWNWRQWAELQSAQIMPLLLGLVLVAVFYWKSRTAMPFVVIFSAMLVFSISSHVGGWYAISLLPLIFIAVNSEKKPWALLAGFTAYTLLAGTFLVNSPFELYLLRALIAGSGG